MNLCLLAAFTVFWIPGVKAAINCKVKVQNESAENPDSSHLKDTIFTDMPMPVEVRQGKLWTGIQFDKEMRLKGYSVLSILKDKQGNVWYGTLEGVSRYNPIANEGKGGVIPFTMKKDLVLKLVLCTIKDSRGNTWYVTPNGVSYGTPDAKKDRDNVPHFTNHENSPNGKFKN